MEKITPSAQVKLISISVVSKWKDVLLQQNPDFVCIDESHYVKSIKSERSKVMFQLSKKFIQARWVLLSGTPAQEHAHLYGQLRLLHTVFHSWFHYQASKINITKQETFYFADRYCGPMQVHIGHGRKKFEFRNNTRAQELQDVLRPFVFRLLKKDVLDLPPIIHENIVVGSLTDLVKKRFASEMDSLPNIREKQGKCAADAKLMALLLETTSLKTPLVCSYLKSFFESHDEKCVLFFHHHEMADGIESMLLSQGKKFVRIDGRVGDMKQRMELLEKLKKECQIGLLSFGACSVGLNIAFVQLCIFCERIFDGVQQVQAESRLHRIGQEGSVILQHLDLEGSTDRIVKQSIQRKKRTEAIVLRDDVRTTEGPQKKLKK